MTEILTTNGESVTGGKSLAVLPFKLLNLITDSEFGESTGDKFLGLGLADALITRLSNVRRFVVRPTSSVLQFGADEGKTKQTDPLEAGRELGVEFLLDGHIQKAGERIRVSVQLLNIAERSTVWAERFDEKFTDVLSLEDLISTQVAAALIPQLSGDEREQLSKRGTDNAAAYEAYLRGRYHFNTFTEDGFARAIVAFNQAIALDPEYALAFAGIANYHNWLGVYGIMPPRECFMAAIEAAENAVALDEELSEAHAALGFAVVAGKYDWQRGEESHRRALELNPHNAMANTWFSLQLYQEGRFDEGEIHARRGVELDPLTPFNSYNVGWCMYFARRFDSSIAQYQKVTAAHPLYPIAYFGLSWTLRQVKRHDEALTAIKRAQDLTADSLFFLICAGQAHAAAGQRAEAQAILQNLDTLANQRYVSPYHVALIYNFLGETENALAALEQALAENEAWLAWAGVEPALDNLRKEPRFLEIVEKTGNPIFFRTLELSGTTAETQLQFDLQIKERRTQRKTFAWLAAAVVLMLATIGFLAARSHWQKTAEIKSEPAAIPEQAVQTPPAPPAPKSIAVLPFTTVEAATEDEQYLGVGTAESVTNKLSELKYINLRSASSVRRYLNTTKTAMEIGRELAVDFVVGGTIQRVEGKVLATLNMTDAATGNVIWTENFEERNNNLFELQDAISEKVVNSLSLRLTKTEQQILTKHVTENGEAYQLYLAGRYHFGKRNAESMYQAINLFSRAIELDAKFALAYTGLADCHALLNWYQEPPPADAWEKAKAAAEKAVELDPNLAEAIASLAFSQFHYAKNFARAEAEFKRAVELKPNYATAHQWYAFFLSANGRHDEAIAEMRRAETLEPRSAVIALAVANVMFYARRWDEAIEQTNKALEIDSGMVGAYAVLRWNYEQKGMGQEALNVYEKERAFEGNTPTSRAKFAHVLAAAGKPDEARRVLADLIENHQIEHVTPYEIAVIYALLNDKDAAFENLQKARNTHVVGFSFVRVDPHLDNLRNDARFAELVK